MQFLQNVSIDAIKNRIMNPNSSFIFFVENLPPKSSLKLKIYAKNTKSRSSVQLEIKTQTLRPAERLIDFSDDQFNNTSHQMITRLRGKHLIIALLIAAAVVTLIVAIMGIIAVFRVRYSSSSIQLTIDGREDDGRDVPQAETMLNNETDDECSSDETLLKCGNTCNDSNQLSANEKNGNCCKTGKGPPDIIPVPYFVNCGRDTIINRNNGVDESDNYKSSCSNGFTDDKSDVNYFYGLISF